MKELLIRFAVSVLIGAILGGLFLIGLWPVALVGIFFVILITLRQ